MDRWRQWNEYAFGGLTLLLLIAGSVMAICAPIDPEMGPIQKLLYLHLPVAANTFVAALVVCIASVGFIGGRRQFWDDLAHAAAAVTVLNGTVLLLTGVCWAKVAWGVWWTWSPRLSFSLILWLLYAVYLALRFRISSPPRRAIMSAVYGIVAFLDVPLLFLSLKLLPDTHPTESGLTPQMYPTLWVWFIAITLLSGGSIVLRYRLARARVRPGEAEDTPISGVPR